MLIFIPTFYSGNEGNRVIVYRTANVSISSTFLFLKCQHQQQKKNMKIIWLYLTIGIQQNLFPPKTAIYLTFKNISLLEMPDRVYDLFTFFGFVTLKICRWKKYSNFSSYGRKQSTTNIANIKKIKYKILSEKLSTKDENKRLKPTKSHPNMSCFKVVCYVTKLYFFYVYSKYHVS